MPGVGTTHHVKIGGQYHLIQPGSYRKRPAPLFGARFATGDPDYNVLNFWQHWAQSCWVGGIGSETWTDDAMYDYAVGVDTTQHEVMVLARDLAVTARAAGSWASDADGPRIRQFTVFNGSLYLLSLGDLDLTPPSRLYRWNGATWSLIKTFTETVRTMEPFGGYLVFGDGGATMNRMSTAEAFTTFNKPGGVTDVPYTMRVYRGKLYAGFGRAIWRLKSDFTWDGSTAFYTAEDINYLHASEVHLGFLYFASQDGHILRTDANNTFDIWQFEPGNVVRSLRSFDGRLFVAVNELLGGTTAQQAVLYQFTGAAVTELKRWGKAGQDLSWGRMRVIGRRLFYGASSLLGYANGFGIGAYDAVEDAHHIWASNQDGTTYTAGVEQGNWVVEDVIFFGGYIWCSVRGHGVFRTTYTFRDVTRFLATYDTTAAGGAPGSGNGGLISSSDFDAGTPGLLKLWNSITIHVDLPTNACSVFVERSHDGGATWATVGTATKTGSATRYATEFKLNNVTGTRFKWRLTLRTTDATRSPQVRGVVVRYLPLPEPNWMWEMTLVLSDKQELLDGTTDAPDVAAKTAALEAAFRAQVPINFVDIDGTEWVATGQPGVLVYDLQKNVPIIGPSSAGAIESDIRVVLLEAVESYS